MKNTIKLNNEIGMDLLKFRDGKMLLQANTGGGKSWAIRRILEQSFDKIPQIILDTEGEFSTLRQKFDYILIGKGHEITADHKTAALLAQRLIKERVSAIIDLFEMSPWERETFVKNFADAMTNAPKNLWLPTLLVVDEAQTYAPEGDKTECGRTLHNAAFKFRKRHFGILFATPRISALSKNIISTCKNKLIGYTSLDIDMKRAAEELGFSSKEQMRSLRDLDPGEFFVFGPAVSKEVIKIKIGEVKTSHGEDEVDTKIAPPSAHLKKALAALADLPQAAAEEARTIAEFKSENTQLKRELTIAKKANPLAPSAKIERIEVPMIGKRTIKQLLEWEKSVKKMTGEMKAIHHSFGGLIGSLETDVADLMVKIAKMEKPLTAFEMKKRVSEYLTKPTTSPPESQKDEELKLSNSQRKILNALSWLESLSITEGDKTQVALLADQSPRSSGYTNNVSALKTAGLITYPRPGLLSLTPDGRSMAERGEVPTSSEELHEQLFRKLSSSKVAILKVLISRYPDKISKSELAELSGASALSSGYTNNISYLRTMGLLDYPAPGMVVAQKTLFL